MNVEKVCRPIFWIALIAYATVMLWMYTGDFSIAVAQESKQKKGLLPQIVKTEPAVGATDVKTTLREIRVTFDRDMGQGMSWTGGEPLFPPTDKSKKARWLNKHTCVLPVKLERGAFYRLGINSKSFQNFRSIDGKPAEPTVIYFATEGATSEIVAQAKTPEITRLVPVNGSTDADPSLKEISVTFNMKMGQGMSWTGSGPDFPESPAGAKAQWSDDGLTCTLPVKLEPGHDYRVGLNSPSHNNFQSDAGVPLKPVIFQFKTR